MIKEGPASVCVCVSFLQAASTASGYGVRFNALCPGFVQTDLFSAIKSNLGRFSHLAAATQQQVELLGVVGWVCARLALAEEQRQYRTITVLQKALWFYEEPSTTEEPFFCLRHHYWFFEELFQEMVL